MYLIIQDVCNDMVLIFNCLPDYHPKLMRYVSSFQASQSLTFVYILINKIIDLSQNSINGIDFVNLDVNRVSLFYCLLMVVVIRTEILLIYYIGEISWRQHSWLLLVDTQSINERK